MTSSNIIQLLDEVATSQVIWLIILIIMFKGWKKKKVKWMKHCAHLQLYI